MNKRSPQTEDKYVVRFPDGLRDRIKNAAEKNKRSMNAEIIHTLQLSYPEPVIIEDIVKDIKQTLGLLEHYKGNSVLISLAAQLDELLVEIDKSKDKWFDDTEVVQKYVEEARFIKKLTNPKG